MKLDRQTARWMLQEQTRPRPSSRDILVRVLASGVCYMDVRQARGEMGSEAIIPGHEFVGEIVALGTEVTGHRIGERVGVTWHQRWCRACPDCVRGRIELCRSADETGIYIDGGHAEYAVVDSASAVHIPDDLPDAAAATLLCSGYVAYSALVAGAAGPQSRVGIFGFGGIGHLATQYAKAFGSDVTVITTSPVKAADAERLGAARVSVMPTDQLGSRLPGLDMLDMALLTYDHPGALMTAIHALAPHGRLVVVAAPTEPVPLVLQRLLHYKLTIVGASQGPRHRLAEVFDLHLRHGIESVVETFDLTSAEAALAAVEDRTARYRVVLKP